MDKEKIAPVHPGAYLKELLEDLGISQYKLAKDLGVPAMRINHVVNGRRPITAELALRLGRYFEQSPRYWLNLQTRYDMDIAEDALSEEISRERCIHESPTHRTGFEVSRRDQSVRGTWVASSLWMVI